MPDVYGSEDGSRSSDILAISSAVIEAYCKLPAGEGLYVARRTRYTRGYRLTDGGYRIEIGRMPATALYAVKLIHGTVSVSAGDLDIIDNLDNAVIISRDEAASIGANGLAHDFAVDADLGWGSSSDQPPLLTYASNVIGDRLVAMQSLGGIPPNVTLQGDSTETTALLDGLEVVLSRFVL